MPDRAGLRRPADALGPDEGAPMPSPERKRKEGRLPDQRGFDAQPNPLRHSKTTRPHAPSHPQLSRLRRSAFGDGLFELALQGEGAIDRIEAALQTGLKSANCRFPNPQIAVCLILKLP